MRVESKAHIKCYWLITLVQFQTRGRNYYVKTHKGVNCYMWLVSINNIFSNELHSRSKFSSQFFPVMVVLNCYNFHFFSNGDLKAFVCKVSVFPLQFLCSKCVLARSSYKYNRGISICKLNAFFIKKFTCKYKFCYFR